MTEQTSTDVALTDPSGRSPSEDQGTSNLFLQNVVGWNNENEKLSFEEWQTLGMAMLSTLDTVNSRRTSLRWLVGDWLVYGEKHFPDRYTAAIDSTHMAKGTLMNAAYICRNVPAENRIHSLGIDFHAEVARVPVDRQRRFLERAEREDMTRLALRKAVREEFPVKLDADEDQKRFREEEKFYEWYMECKREVDDMTPEYAARKSWLKRAGFDS